MSVVYTKSDSVGRKIIPAPLVSIKKNYQSNEDGTKRGTTYLITLTGTLLPYMGSPSGNYSNINNSFWSLGGYPSDQAIGGSDSDAFDSLLRKQEALRWLFNEDGGSLEWQPAGGQPPVRCYPRVLSINFSEGQWADRCEYTIELEAPWILINGTISIEDDISEDLVSSSTETWSFEEIDGRKDKQYRVVHEVSAKGKIGYDGLGGLYEGKQAWEHAKDFVDVRINGIVDSSIMLAALGSSDKITGQYSKVIKVDQDGGTYGMTEEWLLSDETTFIERQFNIDYDHIKDEYIVTYQGTVYGLSSNSDTGDNDNMTVSSNGVPSNSSARSTALVYVTSYLGGETLPTNPDKKTIALNNQDGTTTFTFQWNTSDSGSAYISEEAQHTYSVDNLLNTLTFTQTIDGKGSTPTSRMSIARSSAYSEGVALSKAKSLTGSSKTYRLSSNSELANQRNGTFKATWTWTDNNPQSVETTTQTQESVDVLATIPIPGRDVGPIIQNMSTVTSKIVTVTKRSKGNTSQPTLNTSISDSNTIISDVTTWNPDTGMAERVTKFLIAT